MRLNTLQTELARIERRRVLLQEQLNKEAKSVYASLPAKVGLRTVDALILALAPYASPFLRAKLSRPAAGAKSVAVAVHSVPAAKAAPQNAKKGRKRPPARSAEQKTAVREAFKDGKLTTREISNKYAVPYNTLKKWKTVWRMTKARPRGKK
jgi:hypothetical protein